MQQADKKEEAAAAPAPAKPPSICDRVQRAFHARPAFRPLRRLTVGRHQDGGASSKPTDAAGAAPGPGPKQSGPPVPAPPQPLTPSAAPVAGAPAAKSPAPVRLPAVAEKKAVASSSAPPGPPVPVPPPDVTAGMATPADETKAKTRVGSRFRKALSSN